MKRGLISVLIITLILFTGCTTTPPDPTKPTDPFEHLNRNTMRLNDKIDNAVIKPVARGYLKVTPYFVRRGIDNFFDNLGLFSVIADDILQGDARWMLSDSWRLVFNTTVGVGGLFDVAKHIGLQPHNNDFGLTLNAWYVYTPYFVVPFLGPNTLGDTVGMVPDYFMTPEAYLIPLDTSVMMDTLNLLNTRAILLQRQDQAAGMVLDQYTFYRSAYLQYRLRLLKINQTGPQFEAAHH